MGSLLGDHVRQLSEAEADRKGGATEAPDTSSIDPEWAYNPGEAGRDGSARGDKLWTCPAFPLTLAEAYRAAMADQGVPPGDDDAWAAELAAALLYSLLGLLGQLHLAGGALRSIAAGSAGCAGCRRVEYRSGRESTETISLTSERHGSKRDAGARSVSRGSHPAGLRARARRRGVRVRQRTMRP